MTSLMLFLPILVVLLPAMLRAEPPARPVTLTLAQALAEGLERHPLLRSIEHDALEMEAITKQIEAANYPRVSGIFSNSAGNTRVLANLGVSGVVPRSTNYLTTPGLRVDLLITDFGHTAHRILANKALAASAEKHRLMTKAVLTLTIQQAYLTCLKQQRFLAIARDALAERELIRRQAETLYRHELRSKLDVDFAVVEAQRAHLAVITAENELKAAFAHLSYAMGRRDQVDYVLEPVPLAILPPQPLPSLFEHALAKRPELLGSQDRLRAAEEALLAARALNFGNVTAIGTTGYTWWGREERRVSGEVTNPGGQMGWWGLGISSAVPLYTGGRIAGQVDEAEARTGEVRANTRSIANDIVLQVARAYFSRLTAEQQITVEEQRVGHAREALTLARERYTNNLGSILDVTTATMGLLAAEMGLAESQYNYQLSEAAVAYGMGADDARF